MYQLNDTIIAVSSPCSEQRVIVRISGPRTIEVLEQIFRSSVSLMRKVCFEEESGYDAMRGSSLIEGSVVVDANLKIDAKLYLFLAPHSYTGENLGEIHIHTNISVTEVLVGHLLAEGLRPAGPGEFTARAYLNGKIDLAGAEAVNEIITSSNRFQLAAGQRLLAGRLGESSTRIGSSIMSCLSQIEAGLDFSGEDIEFATRPEAIRKLAGINEELEQLLADSVSSEAVIDLPAVGIAGGAGAGKSSLLNKLLGAERSIVSPCTVLVRGSQYSGTTRDVLCGELLLSGCRCVVFDCAGLMLSTGCLTAEPNNILDGLAQQAAIEALRRALVVVFCVDISKPNWAEDIAIRRLVEPRTVIPVATKLDLLSEGILDKRLSELNELFGSRFIATSTKTGFGLQLLRNTINDKLMELMLGVGFPQRHLSRLETPAAKHDARYGVRDTRYGVALTARHRQVITGAIENMVESINELRAGNEEVAACVLRMAYQKISGMDRGIDERILENIFRRFCIGK